MAIRKIVSEAIEQTNKGYEKDVFAVDVDGEVSTTIIRKENFTIENKQRQIDNLEAEKLNINERIAEYQKDIEDALNLED